MTRLRLVKAPPEVAPVEALEAEAGGLDSLAASALDAFEDWLAAAAAAFPPPKLTGRADGRGGGGGEDGGGEVKVEDKDVSVSSGSRKDVLFVDQTSAYWNSAGSCPHWIQVPHPIKMIMGQDKLGKPSVLEQKP